LLKAAGISKRESSEWQQLAQAPEKVAAYLAAEPDVPTTAVGGRPTSTGRRT
jgi:hypothetical protein